MAEADDSEDHIKKPKRKYKKVRKNVGGVMRIVSVPIKQPEPYETSYGSIITGEYKPEYKRKIRKTGRKKNYANIYKKKNY